MFAVADTRGDPAAGHRAAKLAAPRRRLDRPAGRLGALDDNSRLVYSEILDDERGETAAAFWRRASAWFSSRDINCERVITDNGGCYRSKAWHKACKRTRTTVKKTRPYRPQTNCEYVGGAPERVPGWCRRRCRDTQTS